MGQIAASLMTAMDFRVGIAGRDRDTGALHPQRRRVRGAAAQSVLVAFQILACNLRMIETF
jgi:hypothetical protein